MQNLTLVLEVASEYLARRMVRYSSTALLNVATDTAPPWGIRVSGDDHLMVAVYQDSVNPLCYQQFLVASIEWEWAAGCELQRYQRSVPVLIRLRGHAQLRCQVSIPKIRVRDVAGRAGIAVVGSLWV